MRETALEAKPADTAPIHTAPPESFAQSEFAAHLHEEIPKELQERATSRLINLKNIDIASRIFQYAVESWLITINVAVPVQKLLLTDLRDPTQINLTACIGLLTGVLVTSAGAYFAERHKEKHPGGRAIITPTVLEIAQSWWQAVSTNHPDQEKGKRS